MTKASGKGVSVGKGNPTSKSLGKGNTMTKAAGKGNPTSKALDKAPSKAASKGNPMTKASGKGASTSKALSKGSGLVAMKRSMARLASRLDPDLDLSKMDNAILLSGASCHKHQQLEYALNQHKPVNVFDLQKTMAQAQMSQTGRIRLEGGMAYCTQTRRTLNATTTEAPVELIDLCSGGQVAGVIPKEGYWYTTDSKGQLLSRVKQTHILLDV